VEDLIVPTTLDAGVRARLHSVRPVRVDLAAVAVALALTSVGFALAVPPATIYRPVDAFALALAATSPLALLWRQIAPLITLSAAGSVVIVNAAAGYSIGVLQWPPWIALFTCFALGRARLRMVAVALTGLAIVGFVVLDRDTYDVGEMFDITMPFLLATVAGDATRTRHAYAAARQARLLSESREQALAAERLLLLERGRLARELHDSLGHSVNVMVLQAGVGHRVFAENPEFSLAALSSVETVGRGALDELDRLLSVLRPDGPEDVVDPFTPDPHDLTVLIERIRATGREVDTRIDDVPLTAGGSQARYRILQEALTNAVRHSPGGRIQVRIGRIDREALIEVINESPGPSEPAPGRGLVNMRERARLQGGRFDAERVGADFRVRAWLPVASEIE
jgi:signal transduction histidine kinase